MKYDFGQKCPHVNILTEYTPALVKQCIEHSRRYVRWQNEQGWYERVDPALMNTGHVNFYADGLAALARHSDDESIGVPGTPIVSYTFMGNPEAARVFRVTSKDGTPIEGDSMRIDFKPKHGDVLVMGGSMQRHFEHEVVATRAANTSWRINVTVRAFQ